jgi:hypothetical protein
MATEKVKWASAPEGSLENNFVTLLKNVTTGHLIMNARSFVDLCFQHVIAMSAAAPVEKRMAIEQVAKILKDNPLVMETEIEDLFNDILYKGFSDFGITQVPESTAALNPMEREAVLQVTYTVAKMLIQQHITTMQAVIDWEFALPDWQLVEESSPEPEPEPPVEPEPEP